MRKSAACQLAGNLYPAQSFAPTRLNVADRPTRGKEVREPASFSVLDFLTLEEVRKLHWEKVSKGTAGWIRLCILLSILCPSEACGSEQLVGVSALSLGLPVASGLSSSPWNFASCLAFCLWILFQWTTFKLLMLACCACFVPQRSNLHYLGSRWFFPILVILSFTSVGGAHRAYDWC